MYRTVAYSNKYTDAIAEFHQKVAENIHLPEAETQTVADEPGGGEKCETLPREVEFCFTPSLWKIAQPGPFGGFMLTRDGGFSGWIDVMEMPDWRYAHIPAAWESSERLAPGRAPVASTLEARTRDGRQVKAVIYRVYTEENLSTPDRPMEGVAIIFLEGYQIIITAKDHHEANVTELGDAMHALIGGLRLP